MNIINNPQIEKLVFKIRDPLTQKDEFRNSLSKIGEYLGLEIAKTLSTTKQSIQTLNQKSATHHLLERQPVLVTILRAGIPLYNGLQTVFSSSDSGFIGAMRNEQTLQAVVSYVALPEMEGQTVILIDTMLATGNTLIQCIKIIKAKGPKEIIIASAIAAQLGVDNVKAFDSNIKIYSSALDPDLNEKGFIVPGLGDAGDRCFGLKL